jgi:hypothetical protein
MSRLVSHEKEEVSEWGLRDTRPDCAHANPQIINGAGAHSDTSGKHPRWCMIMRMGSAGFTNHNAHLGAGQELHL